MEQNTAVLTVFVFPDKNRKLDSWKAWVKFVNRKDFNVTNNTRICEKHFDDRFIRKGKQKNTLIRDLYPIPTIQQYSDTTPPSILPTPSPPARKPPVKRRRPNDPEEDELRKFLDFDNIQQFEDLNETHAPDGFTFKRGAGYVVYYDVIRVFRRYPLSVMIKAHFIPSSMILVGIIYPVP